MFDSRSEDLRKQGADPSFSSGMGPSNINLPFNPLSAQIGDKIEVDTPDLQGLTFEVKEILTTTIHHAGESYSLVDYALVADSKKPTPLADPDGKVHVRMRYIDTGEGYEAAAFQIVDLRPASDGFVDQLKADSSTAELKIGASGGVATFERIDEVAEPYFATRRVVSTPDGSDAPVTSPVVPLTYWDFQREANDGSGDYTQYALVEYNEKTKHYATLIGWDVDPAQVSKA